MTDYPSIREVDAADLDGSIFAVSTNGRLASVTLNVAGERAAKERGLCIVGKWDEHIKERDLIIRQFWCRAD